MDPPGMPQFLYTNPLERQYLQVLQDIYDRHFKDNVEMFTTWRYSDPITFATCVYKAIQQMTNPVYASEFAFTRHQERANLLISTFLNPRVDIWQLLINCLRDVFFTLLDADVQFSKQFQTEDEEIAYEISVRIPKNANVFKAIMMQGPFISEVNERGTLEVYLSEFLPT